MENWYQTREGCSIQHGSKVIPPGKKILLTEDLAALHNSIGELGTQVEKTDPPENLEEAGVAAEWNLLQEQKAAKNSSTAPAETKVRKENTR